jgi:hypothetical protein
MERLPRAEPVRQIRIGYELAAECYQIHLALLEPSLRRVSIEAAGDDYG